MTVDLHWNTVDKWVTVVTLLFANPSEPMMCYEYYKSTAAAPKTCNDAVALFIVTPCIISIINTLAIKLWGQDTEYILWKTEKGGKKSDVSEWNNSLDWEVTRYFFLIFFMKFDVSHAVLNSQLSLCWKIHVTANHWDFWDTTVKAPAAAPVYTYSMLQ